MIVMEESIVEKGKTIGRRYFAGRGEVYCAIWVTSLKIRENVVEMY
jgi:hypothetical protein